MGFLNCRIRIFATWSSKARAGALSAVMAGRTTLKLPRRTAASLAPTLRRSANAQLIGVTTKLVPSAAATITLKCRSRDQKTYAINSSLKNLESRSRTRCVVMFHCGSRGFGHQVATDYLQAFLKVMESKYGIKILDRELACAPFESPEGRDYFAAMKCGLNMSFANRQVILHRIREVFSEAFGRSAEDLGMQMIYDVAHNTAKLEKHAVDGKEKRLLVHRKGATRAFGPGHDEVTARYREIGQPVIIGGSMETGSYLLVGTASGAETFFSTAHGSGRTMSRTKARKQWHGKQLQRDLEARGIYVRSTSWAGLAEEAGSAYKDIDEVIAATELAGISKPVARFTPIGNVKG